MDFFLLFCIEKVMLTIFSFYLLLYSLYVFISFSHFIALAKTSSIMLSRTGRSEYPFFVLNHCRKVFTLSLLIMMLM